MAASKRVAVAVADARARRERCLKMRMAGEMIGAAGESVVVLVVDVMESKMRVGWMERVDAADASGTAF